LSEVKKHILILPRWYPNQSDIQLGIFIQNQAKLLKNNFEISVIYVQATSNQTENFKIETSSENGFLEQIVYFKQDTSILKKIINFKRYKKAQHIAFQNINSKVDLCHVHIPIRPTFLAIDLRKSKQIPFVITEHWSGHLNGQFKAKSSIYKWYYNQILKKATKISSVSHFLQNNFKQNTGFDSVVIPNIIESISATHEFEKSDKINLLSVNDFNNEIKNIIGIITAFSQAVQINPNLHLTLVGGGPDENLILNHIKKLKLNQNNITVLGRLSHQKVLKEMQKCDFYVSFSNFETFGMTIAEALLSGKSVISTLCGGPNEFLDETNSIIVNKNDIKDLKNAMLKMSDDFAQFDSKSIAKKIELKYGKTTVLQKLIEFYTI